MTTILDLFDILRHAKRLDVRIEVCIIGGDGARSKAWVSSTCANDSLLDIVAFPDSDSWHPRMTVIKAIVRIADMLIYHTVEPSAPITVDILDDGSARRWSTYTVTAAWETVDGITIECREPSRDN